MGRRKITIEPITERNRAVTFLKRKNGVFKKAFELGVLCSVDVAVIIFEGRSGHDLKLHSYCSVDLHDMAQRELQFQGDREPRGPADFISRLDDADDEEYEEGPSRPGKRKLPSDNVGTPANVSTSNMPDYLSHHNGLHLPNMAMAGAPPGHYDGASPSIGSLLPVSNDRVSNLRSSTRAKRQRTKDAVPSRSRSPSVDQDHLQTSEGVRHIHAPPGHPAMALQAHPIPYHPQQQHYTALFPMGAPGAMHIGPPHGPPMGPPLPPRFEPQYDPALYGHQYPPSMVRQTPVDVGNRDGSGNGSQPANEGHHQPSHHSAAQRERGGAEMFTAFLEAHEKMEATATAPPVPPPQPQQAVNWPAPSTTQGNPSDPTSNNNNNHHGNQPTGTTATTTRPPENWFELLANATTATTAGGGGGGSANSGPRDPNQLNHLSVEIAQILASAPEPPGGSGPGDARDRNDASRMDTTNTEQQPTTTRRKVRVVEVHEADEEEGEARAVQREEEEDEDEDDEVTIVEDVRPRANVAPTKRSSLGDESNGQPSAEAVKAPIKRGRGRPRGSKNSRGKARGS